MLWLELGTLTSILKVRCLMDVLQLAPPHLWFPGYCRVWEKYGYLGTLLQCFREVTSGMLKLLMHISPKFTNAHYLSSPQRPPTTVPLFGHHVVTFPGKEP